jgi:hypothetical protein
MDPRSTGAAHPTVTEPGITYLTIHQPPVIPSFSLGVLVGMGAMLSLELRLLGALWRWLIR